MESIIRALEALLESKELNQIIQNCRVYLEKEQDLIDELDFLKEQVTELKEEIEALEDENDVLALKLVEIREKAEPPPFPLDFYISAGDMLQHKRATFQPMTETEQHILEYASEIEEKLRRINEG